ncbi:NAD(+)/NADH kinase [Desulfosediminicola flagellatus]|uniref:NAD(+)/NADH kinase n=1 Tax=Desulfosediminicola flagellatus TaxID=2569541 RepID=UPI0010ABFE3C|nr:NAD(+)/NADH kinase [Desulfosediminicola flagellatus]
MSSISQPFKSECCIKVVSAGIITKIDDSHAMQHAQKVANWLTSQDISVSINSITPDMDLLIVLGGDGTLLHIAEQAARYSIPVTGINLGNLGFLTEFSEDETVAALEGIIQGKMVMENRLMLKTRVIRKNDHATPYRFALNDIVINKNTLDRLLHLATRVGEDYITTYKADGLIFSSPTGSTAYNLSAGGPLVYPGLNTILVTPICPFMLSSRPILLPASDTITAEFESAGNVECAQVIVDGQSCWEMQDGDRLEVEPAEHSLMLIVSSTRNYFTILRNKLHWGNQDSNS